MNETVVIIVFGLIGYVASFFAGYCFCKYRGLARDHGVCTDDGNRITEATERIEDSERRAEDLIGATQSIASIIKRYEDSATENKDMEQDSAYVDTDLDD